MITHSQSKKYFSTFFAILTMMVFTYSFFNLTIATEAAANNNIQVNTASYIGTSGDDQVLGSAIGNTYVFIAGKGNGGAGFISALNTKTNNIVNTKTFDSAVNNIEFNKTSRELVAISQNGKSYTLDENLNIKKTLNGSSSGDSSSARVTVGRDGKIATLHNKKVNLYQSNGSSIGSFGFSESQVQDIALDSNSQTIVAVGETQKDGGPCRQYRSGWMKAYTYSGSQKWKNYDWSKDQVKNDCADAMPKRVTIGEDGKLYMAAESAGGNSVFRWNGRKLGDKNGANGAIQVKNGKYTDTYNMSSQHVTFVGKYNPSNGNVEKGQFHLGRLSSGKGNTMVPKEITADSAGNVYVAGRANASFDSRDKQTVNGKKIGSYDSQDGFIMKLSPNFGKTEILTAFPASGGTPSEMLTMSASNGTLVVAGYAKKGKMITVNANQASSKGGDEGFYAVWGNSLNGAPVEDQAPIVNPVVAPESEPEVDSVPTVDPVAEEDINDEDNTPDQSNSDDQEKEEEKESQRELREELKKEREARKKEQEERESLKSELDKVREELNELRKKINDLFKLFQI